MKRFVLGVPCEIASNQPSFMPASLLSLFVNRQLHSLLLTNKCQVINKKVFNCHLTQCQMHHTNQKINLSLYLVGLLFTTKNLRGFEKEIPVH